MLFCVFRSCCAVLLEKLEIVFSVFISDELQLEWLMTNHNGVVNGQLQLKNAVEVHSSTCGYLFNDQLDIVQRDTLVVGTDDQLQQVISQHLKHHADVCRSRSRLIPEMMNSHAPK